jgi:hypothetical protein
MGIYKDNGGFVITTKSNNFVSKLNVGEDVIQAVINALKIPDGLNNKDIAANKEAMKEIRSIYIFCNKPNESNR